MPRQLALQLICLVLAVDPAVSVAQDSVISDAANADTAVRERYRSVDQDVQNVKKEFLELSQDVTQLEEALLFPASSQTAFFVALDVGDYFALDSIKLKINGKVVANHLYKSREIDALQRGGVQRLHMANLEAGDHELVTEFIGKGANARDYRRQSTLRFKKDSSAKYVTLEITDRMQNQQPHVVIKDWE
jgi:hypothetical protein